MKRTGISVKDRAGIGPALKLIEDTVCAGMKEPAGINLCLLLSEELLLHLLEEGCTDIKVTAQVTFGPCVKMSARGEPDELFTALETGRGDDTQDEINRKVLRQYDRYIEYRHAGSKNHYRISPSAGTCFRLKDEILDYYEGISPEEKKKTFGLLIMLAKKHPVMAVAGILFRTVRHLAALMIPVYAANILQAFYDHHEFFIKPVFYNLAASLAALTVNLTVVWFENRIYQGFTREVEASLKMALVEKIQTLSFRFHNETSSGKLFSKLASDVQFIKYLLYDYSTSILFMIEDIVFTAVITLIRMPGMLFVYIILVGLYFVLIRGFSKPLRRTKNQMRKKTERSNSMFKEMLSMDQMIRSHGLARMETQRISRSFRQEKSAANRQDNVQLRFNSIGYGLAQGFRLVVLVVSVYFAVKDYIDIGTVVLFLSLLDMMIASTQRALDMSPMITQGVDSLESIHELLSESDTEKNGSRRIERPVKGDIEFRDLVYSYDGEEPVLKGLDLHAPAGKTTAIVGRSGSGKTTILSLILGLYTKDSGRLLIDGIDIDELDKNDFRRFVGVVLQTPLLFSGTLWDNLTYGMNCSTGQVMEALDKVGLIDLVRDNADGLDMMLSEGGMNLSGGQRQRISIARALLRDPDIILLDEATSALDVESEREVRAAIEQVMRTCTVVIVAHRLNTIQKADVVYEIRDGRAIRYDSYEELERSRDLVDELQ